MALSLPPKDYQYIVGDVELEPYVQPSHAKVRLDGDFSVGYHKAYAAAWQQLLHRTNELAMPILYLQRHHLELALKGTLQSLLAIRFQLQTGHEIFDWPMAEDAADKEDWVEDFAVSHSEHKLERLVRRIVKNLKMLKLPPLPADFLTAQALFHGIEDEGDGTRLRYAFQREKLGKKKTTKVVSSFDWEWEKEETAKIANFGELSTTLGRIACVHCHIGDQTSPPSTFWEHLSEETEDARLSLASELQAIEKKTRTGQVVWSWVDTPSLDLSMHEEFKDYPSAQQKVQRRYLTTQHDGRRYAIIVLEDGVRSDGTTEDELVFARQHDERGALTRTLSPLAFYHSSLDAAAQDSAGAKR